MREVKMPLEAATVDKISSGLFPVRTTSVFRQTSNHVRRQMTRAAIEQSMSWH